jgi:Tfp pilus assembly protein PilV
MNKHQRGITLVEALIGVLLLSLGLLGALRMQSWLRLNGDVAQQRSDALRIAQQDLEQARGFANAAAFQAITSQRSETAHTTTSFTLERTVSDDNQLKTSLVVVSWQDRSGSIQSVRLSSGLNGLPPVYSAVLALPPQDTTLSPRRHLPTGARRLSEGRSVLKPTSGSSIAWIVNDATGEVSAECSVPASLSARDITEADLTRCTELTARLLRGYIRFSLGPVPDAMNANDTPLTLTLAPAAARCETEPVRHVGERYLAYTCLLPVGATEALRIEPVGWAFGASASTYKACRYAHANARAPHNYLVIRGDAACPGPQPQHNGVSAATVQHQP